MTDASVDQGPLTLRWGVLVLWIQAALVTVLAVVEIVQLIRNGADRFETAAWIIAGPLVAAAALFFAGRLLVNRKPAGRGLAVAIQLSAVPVVFFMITGDSDAWVKVLGAVIGVSVIACVALVVAPASRKAIGL
ncbi:hypothetical protein [Cryptosporangium phraense]|uniref:Integral membrane protein n=1 Tax=Cryptosporangium phraense TaxID=2593070 RepID=A0A545ALT6_9ACTN|nr:hypothetical protein [Cryptosporangium phraense]TQS42272.1 hypothetical protein FL583_25405 [Cryptosporangium phraense]